MSNREGKKPDWTRSCSLSRRHALALGATAMGGLAGCSGVSEDPLGTDKTTTEPPPLAKTLTANAEFTIDEVSLELEIGSHPEDSLSGTLRLYAAPNLDRSNQTVIAEKSIDQSEPSAEHTLEPDYHLGYAQHFQFTLERDGADEELLYSPEETFVPFYNAARDTEMVLREPPATPEGDWAYADPFYKTDFWFESPDKSPFNTPEVPKGEYDQDWYDYRNITMTALVRFPTYENITEFPGSKEDTATHSPAFDWAVVNLSLDAWELIEAVRWNSIATARIEDGALSASTANGVEYAGSTSNPSLELTLDASSQTDPYSAYTITRYAGEHGETNPLLMSGSRPFTIRAAEELENAFDNPSFDTLEDQNYHKALALQVFVGQNPYGFGTGGYVGTPEETVNRWYKISTGQSESSGNCQDATAMYGGIAVHLLDSTYGIVGMQGSVGYHIMGGLFDLQKTEQPYEIWPDHPSPTASAVFTFETDYGTVSPVECTYPDPTIGWKNSDGSGYELLSYLSETSVLTHIPINSSYEPDTDGTTHTEGADSEIPWEYYEEHTVIDDIENFRAS